MIAFLVWTIVGAFSGAYVSDGYRADPEDIIGASVLGALFAPVAVGVAIFVALKKP